MSEDEEDFSPLYPLVRPGPFISGSTGQVLQLGQRIAGFDGEGAKCGGGGIASQVHPRYMRRFSLSVSKCFAEQFLHRIFAAELILR